MYWWNKAPNFGDALSPKIVELCTGKKTQWAPIDHCDLTGLGSILNFINNQQPTINTVKIDTSDSPVVWGSGLMTPLYYPKKMTANIKFAAVRGPITAACFEEKINCLGDPGLLVRKYYKKYLYSEKNIAVDLYFITVNISINKKLIVLMQKTGLTLMPEQMITKV